MSHLIGRQVGVLINRQGHVVETFVGDAKRIYLPDVGRQRVGAGHLRGLRHIHTVLNGSGLQRDDLVDLTKLRLDMVCALAVTDEGLPADLDYAYILPTQQHGSAAKTHDGPHNHDRSVPHRVEHCASVHVLTLDFASLIQSLETELTQQHVAIKHADDGRPRAVVVGLYPDRNTATWREAEMRELAHTAGVAVLDTIIQLRHQVDHKFVVGRGKLEDVVLRCLDLEADLIIFDHNLTSAQARAIAAFSDLKVIDRTQLILDIFAQHATSRDGKLQVELAQLKYNLSRLTDMDAGLSRLTGGIGGRGPGETKLEINRRRARDRIARLDQEINKLSQRRGLLRSQRQQSALPIISIVGYTNAGKSTLLNALTASQVLVQDQLFATLDPTSRRLRFPREREAIITDTVGFIRDLPPDLMKAFRATLEELEGADVLLHVIDVSDPRREEKIETVHTLLNELDLRTIPEIIVYNKADLIEPFEARALARRDNAICVSAQTGEGLPELVQHIAQCLWQNALLADTNAWSKPDQGMADADMLLAHTAETTDVSPAEKSAQ